MTETRIRKYHGILGIILSIFIVIQVGSGTLIAVTALVQEKPHTHGEHQEIDAHADNHLDTTQISEKNTLEIIHHHGEPIYQGLRVFLGIGILAMALSGAIIYLQTRKRKKQI
ncbi:MAG: hypothetical protein FP813_10185 [Desulfurivibrio sp.]|nr:hypothetical protein [Desulfurivibrio sp.]MBU4119542.1 hypothetical protein [Pseudomonadota bacterium]